MKLCVPQELKRHKKNKANVRIPCSVSFLTRAAKAMGSLIRSAVIRQPHGSARPLILPEKKAHKSPFSFNRSLHDTSFDFSCQGVFSFCEIFLHQCAHHLPQHFLYFFPLPQGQDSLRPTFSFFFNASSSAATASSSAKNALRTSQETAPAPALRQYSLSSCSHIPLGMY